VDSTTMRIQVLEPDVKLGSHASFIPRLTNGLSRNFDAVIMKVEMLDSTGTVLATRFVSANEKIAGNESITGQPIKIYDIPVSTKHLYFRTVWAHEDRYRE